MEKLGQRISTREEAIELQRLIEMKRSRALKRGNTDLAMKLVYFSEGLNGYIAGKFILKEDLTINRVQMYNG